MVSLKVRGVRLPDGIVLGPPDLISCILIVWLLVTLFALCLPRPWFKALFKIAFPFMPDKLEDLDRRG
jgi:hypothetical protein